MPPVAASLSRTSSADRIPPYSEEAERGVLGSILLDFQKVMDFCVAAGLGPDSFYVPAHRAVFETMLDMSGQGKVIDVLTVTERMNSADALDQIGGSVFLDRLVDSTPTAAHAEYYVDIVSQKHILRSIIDCSREAERQCYGAEGDARQILDDTEQKFLNITEQQHGTILAWHDAVKQTMTHVEEILNGAATLGGISTGFSNLDKTALGLRPSEMIVLAARPGMGKTSLAMNIGENIALGKGSDHTAHSVGIFSLEMSQEALAMRMLCGHAKVQGHRMLRGGAFSRAVHGRLTQAASILGKAPIYVDDTGGLDIMEVRARARRMKKKYDIELIVIDYLQLLHSREYAKQGRQLETAHISGNMKAMAKELKVPVLVISQLSRAPEQRDKTARPKLSDLRDSGAIEQDADMVWMLRRPCKYEADDEYEDKTLAIVDVAKQRNGPTGEVRLNFEEEFTCFRDRAPRGVDGPEVYEESVDEQPM